MSDTDWLDTLRQDRSSMKVRARTDQARLASHIEALVNSAPPLSREQMDKLSLIFSKGNRDAE